MRIEQATLVLLFVHLAVGDTTQRPIRHQHGFSDANHKTRQPSAERPSLTTWPVNRNESSSTQTDGAESPEGIPVDANIDDQTLEQSHPLAASCRVNGHYLPVELFSLDTCARCYSYIPDQASFFLPWGKWNSTVVQVVIRDPLTDRPFVYNVTHLSHNDGTIESANVSDDHLRLRESFANEKAIGKWTSCCHRAAECCRWMAASPAGVESSVANYSTWAASIDHCPPTWDGWQCWHQTKANEIAHAPCPDYIYFGTEPPACTRYATKVCTWNGTWHRRRDVERTNYSSCSPVAQLQQRTFVHISAYGVSTAALVPALLIFFAYKQLDVYRIRLHKNMFVSILLNCIMVILFKALMILPQMTASAKDSFIKQNTFACRALFILTRYFRLTNYLWMFCEGYYLHRLIAAAFAEQKSFTVFYLLGWVFPLIPTAIYALIRGLHYDFNCWVTPIEAYEWVLNTPCLVSLVVNMIFLINIIRILVSKLRTAHTNEPSQYRKAVRATLVLVPLFGLHFVVTIYRPPDKGCDWIEVYYYVDYLLDGLQGCLVAIIFCYANGEVHYLLKRSYQRFREERFPNSGLRGLAGPQSQFLGRSTCGSTNFTLVDSPNPLTKFGRHLTPTAPNANGPADCDKSGLANSDDNGDVAETCVDC